MNRIAQEARGRQAVVTLAMKKGKSFAARKYGVSLSSVKRWCKRYDGTWQSLKEVSHRSSGSLSLRALPRPEDTPRDYHRL